MEKNGDYAWLMHILKALKSNGKAAVILPHGVLFRGNAEATIREAIIKKHWIKGIISLPANLFYGTGIAACVLVIDKEGAANRQGIFMIDASRGYVKDGNKNRLRERDIYRIITTFNEQITTDPKYARFVHNDEIEKKNGYNLNITRYIDSTDPEDIQDIYAHIHGGIPAVDIDGLSKYWKVFPSLKSELLSTISEKYYSLNVEHESIRQTIYKNTEFSEYGEKLDEAFAAWKAKEYPVLSTLDEDVSARELIVSLAEDIIAEFEHLTLIDKYDVYQVLLAYWNEVMNDDVSLIISESDGYANARATDNIEEEITQGKNKGEMKVTGWEGRLIPKAIVIDAFFREEKNAIEEAENVVAETESLLSDLIESADEESALADVAENGKVKAKDVEAKIEELTQHVETEETIELEILMNQLPMQKKRLQAYLVGHPLCKSALTDKGTVNKSSIMLRLLVIRTEESIPESLQDALVPGLGQIYNRKYWKLPIVYGGLMGCMYAVTWNNKNYKDYSTAYKDIMYDAAKNLENPDAWSKSWQDLTSMAPEDAINNSNFKDQLKRQKDYFRRYRDLSIIITVGVYALSMVDAYVDAQLFDFDISPDLSLHLEPVVSPKTSVTPRTYGLNCSLKF